MVISSRVSSGAGAITLATLVLIDVLAVASVVPFGFYGLAPLIAATAATPRVTAAVGVAALATASAVALTLGSEPASSPTALILVAVLGLLAVLIARARVAREASLRHAQHVAEVAQHAIIRALPSAVGPVLMASRYVSATKEAQIGGDLYEVSPIPSGLRVIVGDVRGKGLSAVHLAADVLNTFRAWAPLEHDATALLKRLNDTVAKAADDEEFVTAIVVDVIADGTLTVTNSGHHPPVLVSSATPEVRYRMLASALATPPLGLYDLGPAPVPRAFRWEVGDRLLMYTDGLVEAPGPTGHDFPPNAWAPLLRDDNLETCLDRIIDTVYARSRNRLDDDLALVLLQHEDGVAA
jgi:serine phosphatase RsbU (regulator of sigma subunit)